MPIESSVSISKFILHVLEWIKGFSKHHHEDFCDKLDAKVGKAYQTDKGHMDSSNLFLLIETTPFLDLLALLLDEDGDGFITREDLLRLNRIQFLASEALQSNMSKKPEMILLLEIVTQHFSDYEPFKEKSKSMDSNEHHRECKKLQDSLNMKDMMSSYDIKTKLYEYVWGTRDWIFKELGDWISKSGSRLLLLLAGPGMGKSVISSVLPLKLDLAFSVEGLSDPKSKAILVSYTTCAVFLLSISYPPHSPPPPLSLSGVPLFQGGGASLSSHSYDS